jgi:L-amino acid N-acyltransferase YncA
LSDAPNGAVTLRDCRDEDLPAIAAIYAHHVMHGFGSFEEVPPSVDELRRRRDEICAKGLPYLVATDAAGTLLGYAYASPYRPRSAYRYSLEDSIYVTPGATRQGIGKRLLTALVERCTGLGYRQMVAVIGDTANHASIGVHRAAGFREIGTVTSIGYKLGRWVDAVLMQRALGDGDRTPPAAPQR